MDDDSFEQFVATHGPGLLAFARTLTGNRADAEDLLQTALTSAFTRWPSIRPDGALGYLRRSIANGRVSLWRRRSSGDVLGLVPDLPDDASGAGHDEATTDRLVLQAALRRLPRGQRAVLVMRYLLDLPDAEIATTLRISEAGVRSQVHRGLKALRTQAEPATPRMPDLDPGRI